MLICTVFMLYPTKCKSETYTAVPSAADRSKFLRQTCRAAVKATAANYGRPCGALITSVFLRQYTTSIAKTAVYKHTHK